MFLHLPKCKQRSPIYVLNAFFYNLYPYQESPESKKKQQNWIRGHRLSVETYGLPQAIVFNRFGLKLTTNDTIYNYVEELNKKYCKLTK